MVSGKGKNPGDLPTGQHWIEKWPVRTAEEPPDVDADSWTLTVSGMLENPVTLSLQDIRNFGTVEIARDFHCVESWSVPDNKWKGVPVQRILQLAHPLPEARYGVVSSPGGYETCLFLDTLMRSDTLLVWERGGRPLSWEHGYPLRLIVPDLYAYKSVKWVSEIRVVSQETLGFWERKGYHRGADVWLGERFEEE